MRLGNTTPQFYHNAGGVAAGFGEQVQVLAASDPRPDQESEGHQMGFERDDARMPGLEPGNRGSRSPSKTIWMWLGLPRETENRAVIKHSAVWIWKGCLNPKPSVFDYVANVNLEVRPGA